MRRLACLVLAAGLAVVPAALAQEGAAPEEHAQGKAAEHSTEGGHGNLEIWKWANFLLLAGALGYLVGKNAGPFFSARSRQIRKDLIESAEVRKEAEARAALVERRLANLEADIAALRAESESEATAETGRLANQTAAEVAKLRTQAEQEIASAAKAARIELKRYSAGLAVGIAEQKLRDRMTPETEEALARGFVRDLDRPSSKTT